eukprot:scaffold91446_cov48-Phaeocystis_antarctica.AAC.2
MRGLTSHAQPRTPDLARLTSHAMGRPAAPPTLTLPRTLQPSPSRRTYHALALALTLTPSTTHRSPPLATARHPPRITHPT